MVILTELIHHSPPKFFVSYQIKLSYSSIREPKLNQPKVLKPMARKLLLLLPPSLFINQFLVYFPSIYSNLAVSVPISQFKSNPEKKAKNSIISFVSSFQCVTAMVFPIATNHVETRFAIKRILTPSHPLFQAVNSPIKTPSTVTTQAFR